MLPSPKRRSARSVAADSSARTAEAGRVRALDRLSAVFTTTVSALGA